ncbi:hypothetical protein HYS91_04205 [Candidatus Daviesbacteria bacterium]|nr:hypothetical protein [Candidatus Daviesbacteria bacterium]
MNNSKLILGLVGLIIFCLLLIGGAIYFKIQTASKSQNLATSAPATSSPEKVTQDFYKWYIEECLLIDSDLRTGKEWQKCNLEKHGAISEEFIKKLNDTPVKPFDPILCGVEIPESFTASVDSRQDKGLEVNVSKLGLEEISSHNVILKKFNNNYKITNIICSDL